MKMSIKSTAKQLMIVAAVAVVAGSAITMGVFAAIPDSNTGVITACRTNTTGTIRIIDAQGGATCTILETALTWNTRDSDTALARFDVDPNDSSAVVYNSNRSRNIVQTNIVDGSGTTKYICIQVGFTPEVSSIAEGNVTGIASNNSISNVQLAAQGSNATAMINYYCGSGNGYNAIARYDTSLTSANAASIGFQN